MDGKRAVLTLVVVTGLGVLTPAMARAQEPSTAPGNGRFGNPDESTSEVFKGYVYGVVKSVDADELVLDKTKFGFDQVYKFDPKIKVVRDGKPSSRDTLKVGEPVYVQVKKGKKTGDQIAKKILAGVVASKLP
ncbi:MAG TPA: hypothetical protein VKM93_09410 [Terriglobia bacterium]|nr:hypothetical protein [Terriglobia bacterium]